MNPHGVTWGQGAGMEGTGMQGTRVLRCGPDLYSYFKEWSLQTLNLKNSKFQITRIIHFTQFDRLKNTAFEMLTCFAVDPILR